jgi:hypothetical protein
MSPLKMKSTLFEKLDDFLHKNDHESMDWCDGGESENAERLLEKFEERDWDLLREVCRSRSVQWQGCLISILCPQYGPCAQDILVEMANSKDPDIAYEAMHKISFYCGINENSDGAFIDDSIVHNEFKTKLISNSDFVKSIPKIGELVGRKYEILQAILLGKP